VPSFECPKINDLGANERRSAAAGGGWPIGRCGRRNRLRRFSPDCAGPAFPDGSRSRVPDPPLRERSASFWPSGPLVQTARVEGSGRYACLHADEKRGDTRRSTRVIARRATISSTTYCQLAQRRHRQGRQQEAQCPIASVVFQKLHGIGSEPALEGPFDGKGEWNDAKRPGGYSPWQQAIQKKVLKSIVE
jgi:hypothetical protein